MILRAYEYLFYKLYCFERRVCAPSPEIAALVLIVVVQALNVYGIVGLAEWYAGRRLLPTLSFPAIFVIIALLAALQYVALVRPHRFRSIVRSFAGESVRKEVIGGIIVAFYVVFSLVFAIWSVTLLRST